VRWDLVGLAAILVVVSACSPRSNIGFAPGGAADASADVASAADGSETEDAQETSVLDSGGLPDSTCTPPMAATGATSSRCTPDGPGGWACVDASASGWLYSCQESDPSAHPPASGVGACTTLAAYQYADASYAVALCTTAACTVAAQFDEYCEGGTPFACPYDPAEAGVTPANGCVPSFVGQWSSGDGLPGPLYCCP
jgi:hypothetical protein